MVVDIFILLGFSGYQILNNEKPIENENPFNGDLIDKNEKCWIQFRERQRDFQPNEKVVRLRRNVKRKENDANHSNVTSSKDSHSKKRPISWIGASPRPYQRKDSDSNASLLCGLQEYRRKRSSEIIETNNSTNNSTFYPDDPLKSRISQTPINISKNQKLLKTGMLSRQGGPLFHEKLELNIPTIRYNFSMQHHTAPFPARAKEKYPLNVGKQNREKWRGWNKQLQSSLSYWQKRFPCTSDILTPHHSNKIRLEYQYSPKDICQWDSLFRF